MHPHYVWSSKTNLHESNRAVGLHPIYRVDGHQGSGVPPCHKVVFGLAYSGVSLRSLAPSGDPSLLATWRIIHGLIHDGFQPPEGPVATPDSISVAETGLLWALLPHNKGVHDVAGAGARETDMASSCEMVAGSTPPPSHTAVTMVASAPCLSR